MKVYVCEDTNEVCYDYKSYLKTEHWELKKKEYISVYKKECALCKSKKALHLHHKTYDNVGKEKLEDLVLLCKHCHNEVHNNEHEDEDMIKNVKRKIPKELTNDIITHFDFKENKVIMLSCKIGRQCRNSKRKGVINISGNELAVYCVLLDSKELADLNIDVIIERITDRKTKKPALSKPTISKALKGLEDKGYISIVKGSKRQGVKDIYKLTNVETNRVKLFKVDSNLIDKVVNKNIGANELKVYIRMRYLHNEEVLQRKSKGNTYTTTLDNLADSLKIDKANVSKIVKRLCENEVLDRIQIPTKGNTYTYEYKFNY